MKVKVPMGISPFQIKKSDYIQGVRSQVTVAENISNGAVLVHLLCEEERENFFAACFRTPPEDDTGVPHIIEHTVLSGSVRYPVKDPFMEMVKSSMATFINALTYGDRTIYPCGSLNRQDFLNLVSVYMDAVFNPLLKEEFFQQEGYRLDYLKETGKLAHNGVVYNEMKGAYSDPDSYMEREIARVLYPEGSCGKDSGGDPPFITGLTYSKFMKFYQNHYTPGNCCLFALTQIPFQEFADFLSQRIPERPSGRVEFTSQKSFSEPVFHEIPVPDEGEGCTVVSAWKVNRAGDPVETLAFSLLEDVLLEDDSSPLRSALLDSNLGTGLSASGYDSDPVQRNFLCGLKGVKRKNAEKLLRLIQSTLEFQAKNGLKKDLVRSMLHRKELALKYIGSGWPMSLMSAVTAAWTHDEDIFQTLDLTSLLDELKNRMDRDDRFLEGMIEKWLIDNPHRADMVFFPNNGCFSKEERKVSRELERLRDEMTPEELEEVQKKSENLQKSMNTPSTPEALATLPKLHLSEIPSVTGAIYHREICTGKGTLLETEVHTAEVCYVDLALDLTGLPEKLVPYASFYADMMTRTGAGGKDHIIMAEEELACSGGINASVKCGTDRVDKADAYQLVLKMSGYCLKRDLGKMLETARQRLLMPDVGNLSRIVSVAGEMAEHEKSSIIPRGHAVSMLAARAGLSYGHYVSNLLNGIPSFRLLSSIGRNNAEDHAEALEAIRDYIGNGLPGLLAWTGPSDERETVLDWMDTLPLLSWECSQEPTLSKPFANATGIKTGPGTCFAAAALPGLYFDHPLTPSGTVMLRMLSEGFLWDEIRVKRGAYGAGAALSGGAVSFYSYRDPSPASSLVLFREAAASGFEKINLTRRSVEDSIIAGLKSTDPTVRPAMANGMAIMRHLRGLSAEKGEEFRNSLLAVTAESIRDFSNWLNASSGNMRICVMGSMECIDSASIKEIEEL